MLQQGPVLLKLFSVSHAGRSSITGFTVPSQHLYRTHWCQHRAAIPVCHRSSPASCKFSTSLLQNQRQHLFPGLSKWQEGKIFLGLLQTSKWSVCTSDPCWQEEERKRSEKESWGKMKGQIAERQKRRGHCWLERKQVVFFGVVLGQIQWRLASCH